jgi:uncharacterized protein (DUF934 family)
MADIITFRADAAISQEPAVNLEAFTGQSNATAVRIEPGEDARALVPFLSRLSLVEVNFPVFGDGRGYSAARVLREAGYAGELRAVGDVLIDQAAALRRCGFDSFAPNKPLDGKTLEAALNRYPEAYQAAADGRAPIWNLRHG